MSRTADNDRVYNYHVIETFEVRGDNRSSGCWTPSSVKLVQLCCVWIILPIFWIVIPLYMRLFLYAKTEVPLAFTGMRMLDTNLSTVWCQAQILHMNTTFDAYLLDVLPPKVEEKMTMTRHFELDDDLKEYWGIYLFESAEISVTSCSRNLGAYLTIIKGDTETKYFNCVEEQSIEQINVLTVKAAENSLSKTGTVEGIRNNSSLSHNETAIDVSTNNETNTRFFGNEVDESENNALEEDDPVSKPLVNTKHSDGIALDHGTYTHPFAMDDSVSQDSSTSSSEEMLRSCESTVLHRAVIPTRDCPNLRNTTRNLVQFKAPEEGYYYFVFSSTYEIGKNQSNAMAVRFELLKPSFNVADATTVCLNSTTCHFAFKFGSSQRIAVDLSPDAHSQIAYAEPLLDDIHMLESECIHRNSIYLICGLTLPLTLILCAFL